MTTCGMYGGAGAWVEGIGMPAKSGVAGGVLAVLAAAYRHIGRATAEIASLSGAHRIGST
jgi:glutaminase